MSPQLVVIFYLGKGLEGVCGECVSDEVILF